MTVPMTFFRLITSSLRYHARIHASVALGVLAATAVLTGALLVGDSMRGSLRHLTLDRLGQIDELLIVDRFFRSELAQEVSQQPGFAEAGYGEMVPVVMLASTSIENQAQEGRRASGVLAIGCGPDFWQLSASAKRDMKSPQFDLQPDEIVLNEPLAEEIGVAVGDTVVLRLPAADQVPADSPLGRKDNLTRSVPELKVVAIVPATGLGRFSLRPNQALPRNAYVAPQTLQDALEQPGLVNALLVSRATVDRPSTEAESAVLQASLQPRLSDYGLALRRVIRTWNDAVAYEYFQLTSDRMLLEPEVVAAAQQAFATEQPQVLFTYLANRIEPAEGDKAAAPWPISYSTVSAVDSTAGLGPALDRNGQVIGPLRDDEIVVNDWAQRDQQFALGDQIRVTYFEPETTHGEEKTTSAVFTLRGVTPLHEPVAGAIAEAEAPGSDAASEEAARAGRPTRANDPDLTPAVKGVTDAESISKWDAPFPVDYSLVRPQDDRYWDDYRTTPKAFISRAAGAKLWGSRWGQVTAVRFPARPGMTVQQLEETLLRQLQHNGVTLGFEFQPIKRRDLAASSGTTPFDYLFLGLSFFIVAAAVLLVVLLFRLGVEQRATEIGVLLGLGWTRRKVARWLVIEGAMVAAMGAAIGVLAGVGYAWLMLVGLRTWWLGAVATPFLQMYATPRSLAIGYVAGVLVSVLAIAWGLRQARHVAIRRLLAGQASEELALGQHTGNRWSRLVAAGLFVAAIGLAFLATRLRAEAQAGAFLGCGAAVLGAVLLVVREQLRRGGEWVGLIGRGALARLALRSAARNPSRSLLTLALVGSAGFLIVALSAFRLDPSRSGSGGFELVGESAQAILVDLNDPAQRAERLADDAALLEQGTILPFRLQPGDDASCRNLYQPTQPQVLGVTPAMVDYYDAPERTSFAWSTHAGQSPEERSNPWRLLAGERQAGEAVPVVIDQNTALYSLKLYGGAGEEFEVTYPGGSTVRFRVAGLLSNSVLQGSLLVGEADFKRLFPQTSGYRFFLIHAPGAEETQVATAMERQFSDEGLDLQRSHDLLADLMAVQNTYLSTFQTLGALGLVLGTFGLAAVQLRSVLERRGELGLLRAAGFRTARLARLVLLENIVLLVGGLLLGSAAALIAVLPHMLLGGAEPPLLTLAFMLGLVLVVGCLVGTLAVRATLRIPLIAALRGE
jgi:putative ABC transport system permease protein